VTSWIYSAEWLGVQVDIKNSRGFVDNFNPLHSPQEKGRALFQLKAGHLHGVGWFSGVSKMWTDREYSSFLVFSFCRVERV
jgi:hypothetical protein